MEDFANVLKLSIEIKEILLCIGFAALASFTIFTNSKRAKLIGSSAMRGDWPKLLLISLFIPAIPEEIIFRGLWYSADFSMIETFGWAIITTIIFTAWHIFEGITFLKSQKSTFLNPWFLACTAVLGIANCAMIIVSKSIWPAIIFHWLLVFIWQARYGGVVVFPANKS